MFTFDFFLQITTTSKISSIRATKPPPTPNAICKVVESVTFTLIVVGCDFATIVSVTFTLIVVGRDVATIVEVDIVFSVIEFIVVAFNVVTVSAELDIFVPKNDDEEKIPVVVVKANCNVERKFVAIVVVFVVVVRDDVK